MTAPTDCVPLEPRPARVDVAIALCTAPVFLSLWRVAGTADLYGRMFDVGEPAVRERLGPWLWQFGTFALLFLALPIVHVVVRRLGSFRDLGWGRPRGAWAWTLGGTAAAVLLGWLGSHGAEVSATYPMYRGSSPLVYEAAYVLLYYLAWEWYFRGYLLFTLAPRLGDIEAVLVSAIPACLVHIGKPTGELIGSFPFSVAMGWLAIRTRSFWPCFLIHVALGVSTDVSVTVVRVITTY